MKTNKTTKTTKAKSTPTKAPASAPATVALNATPAKLRSAKVAANTTAKPAEPAAAPKIVRREVTSDQIAVRAFILWEKQGRPQGQEVENWLAAERQLKEENLSLPA